MSNNPLEITRKNVTPEVYARILRPKVREYGGDVIIGDDGSVTVEVEERWKQHIIDDLIPPMNEL